MKYLYILITFIVLNTQTWAGTVDITDKTTWLQLLHDKKYATLEKELSKLQDNYEKRASSEGALFFALSAFENSDPNLKRELEQWVEARANSIFSHLALGRYHLNLGWLCRGSRWSKDTSSQQFAKMHAHFQEAKDEFVWVVLKNPKQPIAYHGLISIAMTTDRAQVESYFKEGVKYNPLSYMIRSVYQDTLLPKWGGSFTQIREFLDQTSKLYAQNDLLRAQEGFLEYAYADQTLHRGDSDACSNALVYFDRAVEKNRYGMYRHERAYAYTCLNLHQKAIDDNTEALAANPQNSRYLTARAQAYLSLSEYNRVVQDTTEALKYDKKNPVALQTRGFAYYVLEQSDRATIDLLDSLVYGFENPSTHEYLGYIYYYTKKNYSLAAKSLKLSSEFGNQSSSIWYLITVSQWHNRDCEFVASAKIYADRCKTDQDCEQESLDWALTSAAYAEKSACK